MEKEVLRGLNFFPILTLLFYFWPMLLASSVHILYMFWPNNVFSGVRIIFLLYYIYSMYTFNLFDSLKNHYTNIIKLSHYFYNIVCYFIPFISPMVYSNLFYCEFYCSMYTYFCSR